MSAAPHPVPFHHAQHIGSLLRPQELLDTRIAYEQGKTPLETLRKAEDKAIADIVALQAQEVGIPCISDGEFRRHMVCCDGYRRGNSARRHELRISFLSSLCCPSPFPPNSSLTVRMPM